MFNVSIEKLLLKKEKESLKLSIKKLLYLKKPNSPKFINKLVTSKYFRFMWIPVFSTNTIINNCTKKN
ncbi:MAG: hypothetical protein ACJAZ2_002349 [Glaciecola sp.]|jgi:hypothetical protein